MGRKTGEKIKNLCIFALPGCLIFCAVVILPFLYGFYLTLTDWDGVSKVKNIIGVQNYISVFKDTAFWNDYLRPSLVLGKKNLYTLPLSTYSFYGTYSSDYGVIMAALVLTVAPILVLYLFLQKEIIDGVVAGAVKS